MDNIWLILTNPYSYDRPLERFFEQAQSETAVLNVAFAIDPAAMGEMVDDLGNTGWLSSASLRSLQASLLEGYRALASDVLEEVGDRASEAGLTLETKVVEQSIASYIRSLIDLGATRIIVGGSKSLALSLGELLQKIEWIEQE